MVQFSLNIDNTVRSIARLKAMLPLSMKGAVRNTSRIFLGRIMDKTPSPPTPLGQVYIRTGRLREGWQGAANELGMGAPSILMPPPRPGYYGASPRERDLTFGDFQERIGPDRVSFLMRNNVPYAFFVEVAGPGFPPRGGVWMVRDSSVQTEPDFIREIQSAWASMP